jgi:AraC-like DNA-binding protein
MASVRSAYKSVCIANKKSHQNNKRCMIADQNSAQEKKRILDIARHNGFPRQYINNMIKKQSTKKNKH